MLIEAVILAAGKGVRLAPLTDEIPKPMLPLGDTTIIGNILKIFGSLGIKKASIIIGHKSETLREYLKNNDFGIDIKFIYQKKRLGTGHALMVASEHIDSDFVCVYGDLLFREDFFLSLLSKFKSSDYISVMALTESKTPEYFGSVSVQGQFVKGIYEKSDNPPSNLINTGIYCFKKEAFSYINRTEISERGEYELTDSLKLMIEGGKGVGWLSLEGKWIDIGRPWDLIDANIFFLEGVKSNIATDALITEGSFIGERVHIGSGSKIDSSKISDPCIISRDVTIASGCSLSSSVVRDRVKIGKETTIENSVIMEGAKIGKNCKISFSIIGENAIVEDGVTFESGSDETVKFEIKGEIIDSKRNQLGSIVGKGVKIEKNTRIPPGQKIVSSF